MSRPRLDVSAQLSKLQGFLTMPRETLPRATASEAGRYLRGAAERLGLEYAESAGVAPTFTLLPRGAVPPVVTLFQTWHAEALPAEPAAIAGAERLALGAAIAGAEAAAAAFAGRSHEEPSPSGTPFGLVVAPSASAGSRGLDQLLREHRERLAGKAAYWLRVTPARETVQGGGRRRVFLGARGRVVIAMRGGDGNPYRARDAVVEELRNEAYGPRPLDFELMRKLIQSPDAMELLAELPGADGSRAATTDAPAAPAVPAPDERLRRALFDPRGEVVIPAVPHPDRPRAWLTFETAEAMEAGPIAKRIEALSGGGSAEVVESFPWDRANIHHPAVHGVIELSRSRSRGAEIWPSAPWSTPSGLFSRALGVGLIEWGLPLPSGAAIRFPKPEEFEPLALEASDLLLAAWSGDAGSP
jgi:hypothetical protein